MNPSDTSFPALAHRDLSDKDILKGFIKYYVLFDFGIDQVVSDIVYQSPVLFPWLGIYGYTYAVIWIIVILNLLIH